VVSFTFKIACFYPAFINYKVLVQLIIRFKITKLFYIKNIMFNLNYMLFYSNVSNERALNIIKII
jgi:hypothetical protein